jgi:hypothetical protein
MRVDPELGALDAGTGTALGGAQNIPLRIAAGLAGLLGLLAMALAMAGLYGVLSHLVAHRTREMGLRMALGADRARLVRMVMIKRSCSRVLERDVRELLAIGDIETFGRFVRLCAGRSGQLLNLSSLGSDAGTAHTTARRWLSVLVTSGPVHLLQPHHASFSKRLIKSPKLYFLDSGLVCYLLRVTRDAELATHPLRGAVFETFVVSELFKVFAAAGREPPLFFWRDKSGHEVDSVIDLGSRLIPVEIKSGATVARDFFAGLSYWLDLPRNVEKRGVLVYGGGEQSHTREGHVVRPWFACS